MHELAVAEAIARKAAEVAAGRRVRRITIELGAQSCVSNEALAFSFALVAEAAGIEGAELDVRAVTGDALNLKSLEVEGAA